MKRFSYKSFIKRSVKKRWKSFIMVYKSYMEALKEPYKSFMAIVCSNVAKLS